MGKPPMTSSTSDIDGRTTSTEGSASTKSTEGKDDSGAQPSKRPSSTPSANDTLPLSQANGGAGDIIISRLWVVWLSYKELERGDVVKFRDGGGAQKIWGLFSYEDACWHILSLSKTPILNHKVSRKCMILDKGRPIVDISFQFGHV